MAPSCRHDGRENTNAREIKTKNKPVKYFSSIRSFGTRVIDGCGAPWEPNPSSLQEQGVPLTTESSLQPFPQKSCVDFGSGKMSGFFFTQRLWKVTKSRMSAFVCLFPGVLSNRWRVWHGVPSRQGNGFSGQTESLDCISHMGIYLLHYYKRAVGCGGLGPLLLQSAFPRFPIPGY